jgi:hypothetical protein
MRPLSNGEDFVMPKLDAKYIGCQMIAKYWIRDCRQGELSPARLYIKITTKTTMPVAGAGITGSKKIEYRISAAGISAAWKLSASGKPACVMPDASGGE